MRIIRANIRLGVADAGGDFQKHWAATTVSRQYFVTDLDRLEVAGGLPALHYVCRNVWNVYQLKYFTVRQHIRLSNINSETYYNCYYGSKTNG